MSCRVKELQGWRVAGLTSYRVEELKGWGEERLKSCRVEELQGWRVAGLRSCRVEELQGWGVAGLRSCRVRKLQGWVLQSWEIAGFLLLIVGGSRTISGQNLVPSPSILRNCIPLLFYFYKVELWFLSPSIETEKKPKQKIFVSVAKLT